MKKRFWAAVGVGALVGGAGVLGFGPLVRAKVADKAARYGAEVHIQHVVPGWKGVHLKGVDIGLVGVPGVRVWLDDVVVGWSGQRPRAVTGGRVTAIGSLAALAAELEGWRRAHVAGSDAGAAGGAGGGALAATDFELRWRDKVELPDQTLLATGVSLTRQDGVVRMAANSAKLQLGDASVEVEQGRAGVRMTEAGPRLVELGTTALVLRRQLSAQALAATGGSGSAAAPGVSASAAASSPAGSGQSHAADGAPAVLASASAGSGSTPAPHRRVAGARRALQVARQLASQVDALLDDEAAVAVSGARAELTIAGSPLNLGPGTLRVWRDDGRLVVALEPEASAAEEKPLTFSVRVPIGQGAGKRALEGQLVGGPVWLNLLGVREGDVGLVDVADTSIESDLKVTLPPDGKSLLLEGRGKLHKLSINSARLAPEPLRNMEVAWRAKLKAQLDGSRVQFDDAELDIGALRLLVAGSYQKNGDSHDVDMRFELPLVSCQSVLEALPKALVSRVASIRMVGSLAAKGHARFRTASIKRDYDVDFAGTNSCRIVEVPPELDAQRFKTSFVKTVYTPEGQPRKMTFGPDTDRWVPLSAISHFMENAVLTTEDARFFRHNGFDREAIINSMQQNIEARRFVRGASTISMQLAKNLYLPRTKTIARKLQEAVLTMYLEQALTKNEMMELYLNVIEYGPMIYGIGPASRHYFNSHPGRLSLGQALYLGSILSAPKRQYFGSGGAVTASRTAYLRRLMKIVHKIGRISDEELELGLRETVIFGSPSPALDPPADEDIYGDDAPDDSGGAGGAGSPDAGGGHTHVHVHGG